MNSTPQFRCGYITIAGKPNVGKSTLLNQILGQKIAIISEKPQTTRNRILGVKTLPQAQLIFLDTPGIHQPGKALNKYLVETALKCAKEADLIYMMIEANNPWAEEDLLALKHLKKLTLPIILIINKIDLLASKSELLPIIDQSRELLTFKETIPLSALEADGIQELIRITIPYLPESPALFPQDILTDQTERFLVAEIVREKIFRFTHQEIPYATAVTIEEWEETEKLIKILGTIYVERDSQKGIIIGHKGCMLKKIGTDARKEIEQILGIKIFLQLRVKVLENWTKNPDMVRRMGYR